MIVNGPGGSDTLTLGFTYVTEIIPPTVVLSSDANDPNSGPFTVTATFSEPVTGFDLSDVVIANGTASNLSGSGAVYTFDVAALSVATVTVDVGAGAAEDGAGNTSLAADTLVIALATPATEFAEHETEIRQVVVDAAQRNLTATLSGNRRLVSDARTRFISSQQDGDNNPSLLVSRNDIPFDLDGVAQASNGVFSTSGSFFEQRGDFDGTHRRLFFGDFDVQHDSDTGSTTGTVSGRLAWERSVSDRTMMGYYIGAEVARSEISGSFDGSQTMFGASIGGYFVSALRDGLFLDGFLSFGIGQNQLQLNDGTLELESDYLTQTGTAGAALTGVLERPGYEIWPELAFTFGKTFVGTTDFVGHAYGLVDNDLSLDAGDVSIANITLRTEFRVPMDRRTAANSLLLFTFAPRVICEQVTTSATLQTCGGGAEVGIISTTNDGMGKLNAKIMLDQVGDSTRTGLELNLEHRF